MNRRFVRRPRLWACLAAAALAPLLWAGPGPSENLLRNGTFASGLDDAPWGWGSYAVFNASRWKGNPRIARFTFGPQGVSVAPDARGFDLYQHLDLTAIGMDRVRFSGQAGLDGPGELHVVLKSYSGGEGAGDKGKSFSLVERKVVNTSGALEPFETEVSVPDSARSLEVEVFADTAAPFGLADFRVEPIYTPVPKPKPVLLGAAQGGTPLRTIWVGRDAPGNEWLAARLLRQWLYRLSGAAAEIKEWDRTGGETGGGFFIGRAAVDAGVFRADERAALPAGGYGIRITDRRGAVCGGLDNLGNVEGVVGLLRELGLRIYAREVIRWPDAGPAVVLPTQSRAVQPALARAWFGGWRPDMATQYVYGYHYIRDYWGDPADISLFFGVGSWVHSSTFLLPPLLYHAEHPEYFAMVKGKRLEFKPGQRHDEVHLCLSNPKVHAAAAERVLRWIERQPACTYFTLAPGDGMSYCACPACAALNGGQTSGWYRSDSWMTFVNGVAERVAARYPDKRIVSVAYTACTEDPPRRVQPRPGIQVMYATWPSDWPCDEHAVCDKAAEGVANTAGWTRLCPGGMSVCDYPWNACADMDRLRWFREQGVTGIYHLNFRGTFPWVTRWLHGQWLWNPALDVGRALDEFMEAFYGPASAPMRRYYDLLAQLMTGHRHERPGYVFRDTPDAPTLLTPEFSRAAHACFEDAIVKAGSSETLLRRIRKEHETFLENDLSVFNKASGLEGQDLAAFARHLGMFVRILTNTPSQNTVFRNTPVRTWLTRVARVEAGTNQPWYADPVVRALAEDPESVICPERPDQEPAPGGWRVPAEKFWGRAWPASHADKQCLIMHRAGVWPDSTEARFHLKGASRADARLTLTVLSDAGPAPTRLRIAVNGRDVYDGPVTISNANWQEMSVPVPAAILTPGCNRVRVFNMTAKLSGKDGGLAPSAERGDMSIQAWRFKQSHGHGWVAVAELRLDLAPVGEPRRAESVTTRGDGSPAAP